MKESALCHCSCSGSLETGRDDAGRVPDGGSVVMTGSGPKLGVLLLLAVLLQTVVVTITVLHFTTALNSVRKKEKFGPTNRRRAEAFTHRRAVRTAGWARSCSAFERSFMKTRLVVDLEHSTLVSVDFNALIYC